MEGEASSSLKRKEKKYVQGPKLKILPSQLERAGSPPVLLNLLETFSRMKKGGEAADEMTDKILENASAADRRSLLPVVARSGMNHPHAMADDDSMDESAIDFSSNSMGDPRHMAPSDDEEEVDERVKTDKDAWKHAQDPWHAHEDAGFNNKVKKWGVRTPMPKIANTQPLPRRGGEQKGGGGGGGGGEGGEEGGGGSRRQSKKLKRSKTAMGMKGESTRVQTDLNKVLELAENMLIGNTPSNRLENALYGGSDDLSAPRVRINQDDVLEITQTRGGQIRRMRWNEHAEARVCGVLAMKELLQRHQAMKKRKEEVEGEVESMRKDVQKAEEAVGHMREKREVLASEVKDTQAKLRKAEAALEREKTARQREVLKLNEIVKELRSSMDSCLEEKDGLSVDLSKSEEAVKKQLEMVATLRKEVETRQNKERDDAARFVKQMNQNTRDTLERERLEHEIELLNDDFEYCKKKLTSVADHEVRVATEYDERIRRMSSELNYKLAQLTGELELQANMKAEHEAAHAAIAAERDAAVGRVLALEEQLEMSLEEQTALQEEKDVSGKENDVLRRKVQWTWLMSLILVKNAFPPNADAACQSSSSLHMVSKGTSTHGAVAETGGASVTEDFWVIVRRMSRRLDLKEKDQAERMSLDEVLQFIDKCYKQKAIADLCDDRELKSRQTFTDFLHLLLLEETQDVKEALKKMARVVANLEMYCLLSSGPGAVARKGYGPSVGSMAKKSSSAHLANSQLVASFGEDIGRMASSLPRITLFSRFLGLDTGGYQDAIPREGLDTFLALLVRMRKGQLPMLPFGSSPIVKINVKEVNEAMEYVFARLDQRSRIEMRMRFTEEVPSEGGLLDLDSALVWLTDSFKTNVYDKTEDMLRSLFTMYDDNDNADLEFFEFVNMTAKLKVDHRDILSNRQMLRMYAKMLLHPRVDSGVFVKVAKEFGLCEFKAGPFAQDIGSYQVKLDYLVEETKDQWNQVQETVVSARKFKAASSIGLRMEEHENVLKEVLQTRTLPELSKLLLSFLAEDAGITQLPEPDYGPGAEGRRSSTATPVQGVQRGGKGRSLPPGKGKNSSSAPSKPAHSAKRPITNSVVSEKEPGAPIVSATSELKNQA